MELRELRSFSTAARLGGISAAADRLGLGQPTVTTHVRKLERELGMTLFDRVRRPIQLTPAGVEVAALVAPLLEGIDALAEGAARGAAEGPVAVAATHDIITHALLRVVRVFLRIHSHAHLRIRSGLMREVLEMVSDGEADLGLVPSTVGSDEFDFTGLFAYERVLITPPDHPLLDEPLTSLAQIAEWPLIMRGKETHTRALLDGEFAKRGLDYEVRVELDSMDMIKRYVALGMGVSVGPMLAIEPADREELGIVGLSSLLPVDQGGIVTLKGKTLSTPAQSFIQATKDTLSVVSHSVARA
jgi:DNA-binding transcriptional LysR family regulator